ncbi:cytochrome c oxidase assembly protein [Mangrovitalea sediminis]|uniref:cytochrome c oxidase assembly protein n=1 Tax=Mangrovitalea sediminis TaxID=1982043 RepID=UPI001D0D4CFA|nr:cytochrome c oxidase assembly protein [Mangrovitalea sediminis]
MDLLRQTLSFLLPYEFSPTVLLLCGSAVLIYVRGICAERRAGRPSGFWRPLAFLGGVVLIYGVLQTRYDYLSQHMFFIHRIQHLVLHHIGPFLIALSAPQALLRAGLPTPLYRRLLAPCWHHPLVRGFYRTVQQPVIAGILFVGLIYLWLTPSLHFYAMLNVPLYNLMNWSMAVDGLLFWWLILNPSPRRDRRSAVIGYGGRIVLLFTTMVPQIAIGAYIALSRHDLYNVYAICGRLWPISARLDQQIGGLMTWIPPAMMSVLGILMVIRLWRRQENLNLLHREGLPAIEPRPPLG